MGKDRREHSPTSSKKKKKKHYRSSSEDEEQTSSKHKKKISYEKELENLKEEHRKRKELIKATESTEERKLRRLAKKEEKQKKYNRLMGVDDLGYSNTNNPFGDTHLTDNFVWKKKSEQDGVHDAYEQVKRQKGKQEELRIELEKVKKRREDREAQKLARDEEMSLIQREKEAALFSGWEKQEDEFHLQQARLRSSIRIRDGRAKTIDLLAAYINPSDDDLEIQMHEPYAALVGLSIDDLEDLIEDIKIYITIDKQENIEFWEDITIVVKDELQKLKVKRKDEVTTAHREVINNAVQTDINSIFRGKTYSQLIVLQKSIKGKLKAGGSIDVGYWESLLEQLKAFMAKARLKERHQIFLKKKLSELKLEAKTEPSASEKEQSTEEEEVVTSNKVTEFKTPNPIIKSVEDTRTEENSENNENENEEGEEEESVDEKAEIKRLTEAELVEQAMKEYESLGYEPPLISFSDLEEEKWLNTSEDLNKLTYLREQVKKGSTVEEELEADSLFNTEVLRGMNENEEAFNTTVNLTSKKYMWSDKYRPRKPRFFNRVHTGYEWNKYNQTHYDQDNPPPKIVQGYKFNIFFPDLIDKTATPEYSLKACEDDPEFCILRFKAGPPYEDIAFKVVDREWECSNRHGFRCQFYNNIFQLYFHFKRYRYRR